MGTPGALAHRPLPTMLPWGLATSNCCPKEFDLRTTSPLPWPPDLDIPVLPPDWLQCQCKNDLRSLLEYAVRQQWLLILLQSNLSDVAWRTPFKYQCIPIFFVAISNVSCWGFSEFPHLCVLGLGGGIYFWSRSIYQHSKNTLSLHPSVQLIKLENH